MSEIPPRGEVEITVSIHQVRFGADVVVAIRRLEGTSDKEPDWFMVAAVVHMLNELNDAGYDVMGIARAAQTGEGRKP